MEPEGMEPRPRSSSGVDVEASSPGVDRRLSLSARGWSSFVKDGKGLGRTTSNASSTTSSAMPLHAEPHLSICLSTRSSTPRMKGVSGLRYTVTDNPPLAELPLLALQHLVTFMGMCALFVRVVVPAVGGSPSQAATVISSLFVCSGASTLLQLAVGSRLPLVVGPSFSHALGVVGILLHDASREKAMGETLTFETKMQDITGALLACAVLQAALGYLGLAGFLARFLSPVSLAPTVVCLGIASYGNALEGVVECPEIGLFTILGIVLLSQYTQWGGRWGRGTGEGGGTGGGWGAWVAGAVRRAGSHAVGAAAVAAWLLSAALTHAGVFDGYRTSPQARAFCRTDDASAVLSAAPWFALPTFFEWGLPQFNSASILIMMAATTSACVESVGCYNAVARVAGAPVPEVSDRVRQNACPCPIPPSPSPSPPPLPSFRLALAPAPTFPLPFSFGKESPLALSCRLTSTQHTRA